MSDKRTVLVVEDSPMVRESLCAVLQANGFEVRCCGDGTSALDAAHERDFHAVITDYSMPDMNGAEVARLLRPRFPVSIIIGVSSDDRKEDFLAAGADAFLLKPYRFAALVALLNTKR